MDIKLVRWDSNDLVNRKQRKDSNYSGYKTRDLCDNYSGYLKERIAATS